MPKPMLKSDQGALAVDTPSRGPPPPVGIRRGCRQARHGGGARLGRRQLGRCWRPPV